jgi:O-antigen/teichoic acid export membrane protein
MARRNEKRPTKKISQSSNTANMASFLIIGKLISFFLLAASFIIVVRILGPSVYGVYTIAIAVGGFFGAVGNFGISTILTKFISEYKEKKDPKSIESALANSFAFLYIIGAILTIAVFASSTMLSNAAFHNGSYAYIIQLASLTILASIISSAATSALVGLGKGTHAAISLISLAVVQSIISVGLALVGFGASAPLIGLILGYVVSFLVTVYYIYIPNKLKAVMPTKAGLSKLIHFSSPLAASNFLGTGITNLVPIVLGIVATTAVVGNLGVASRTSNFLDIIGGAISMSLIPMFAGSIAKGDSKKRTGRLYTYSVYFSFVLIIPILIMLFVLAKPFSYTVFSGAYTLAPNYIMIFSIGFLIGIIGSYTTQLLVSANKVKKILKYNAIIALIQLLLIPIMIPLLQGIGAALLLFLITPLLINVFFIREIKREFDVDFWVPKLLRVVLANLIIGIILVPLVLVFGNNYIPLIAASVVAVLIAYPPILALTKGIGAKETSLIKRMSLEIPLLGNPIRKLAQYSEMFASGQVGK